MTILDRYLLGKFWRTFAGLMAACAVLLTIVELLAIIEEMSESNPPLARVGLYFLFFLPFKMIEVLPLMTILATLFSIGLLAHKREMIAITTAGLSPLRVAAPLGLSGLLISVATVLAGETLLPWTETNAYAMRKRDIEGKQFELKTDIFAKGEKRLFYRMSEFDGSRNLMINPMLLTVNPENGHPSHQLEASSATLVAAAIQPGDRTRWEFHGLREMTFNDAGRLTEIVAHEAPVEMDLEKNLHKYLGNRRSPKQMGALELRQYIEMLESHHERSGIYRTDFWLKILFPFASLIFVIAGFSFAMRAQAGSLMWGFTLGLTFAVGFYITVATTQAMGHADVVPPLLATLGPLIVFGAVSLRALRRSAYTYN